MAEITGLTADDLAELLPHMAKEDAAVFENILKRNGDFNKKLAERGLRQSDYDRYMNKTKGDVDKATKRAKELEDWYTENKPIHDRALEHAQELEKQANELQKQLEEAKVQRVAEGGDQVDAAELERRVKETIAGLGYVSKTEIGEIIKTHKSEMALEEAQKYVQDANKKYYEETLPATTNFIADVTELVMDHKAEFGGNLNRQEFADFMRERNLVDPKKAYEEYVRPKRQEKELETKVEERMKVREAELRQQFSGQALNGGTPSSGFAPKGALQMKIEKDNAEKQAAGSGVLAAQAAAELRAENKF